MTAIILLEAHEKGTKYTAIALHSNQESRKRHEDMAFHEGWSICADQLVAMIKSNTK